MPIHVNKTQHNKLEQIALKPTQKPTIEQNEVNTTVQWATYKPKDQ